MSYVDWEAWDAQWPEVYAPAYTYADAAQWGKWRIETELKTSIARRNEYRQSHDKECLNNPGSNLHKDLFEACMRLNNIITILIALRMST